MGRILRPHGLGGEVTVEVLTDSPERFSPGSDLGLQRSEAGPAAVRIERSRPHKRFLIVKLEGVSTRTAAEAFRGRELLIPEGELRKLPSRHYYPFRLVGCEVVSETDGVVGIVRDVLETGAAALLQVEGTAGEVLIPMVESIVLECDEAARRIRVALPPGLVRLNS